MKTLQSKSIINNMKGLLLLKIVVLMLFQAPLSINGQECKTFVELARDTPGFTTLYNLVVMADLGDDLSTFDGTLFGKKNSYLLDGILSYVTHFTLMLTSYVHSLYTRTIKAPNDDAFAMLPQDDIDYLTDPDNKADLVSVLTYHLIENPVESTDLLSLFGSPSENQIATANGEDIVLKLGMGGEYDIMINEASVIDPFDVMACDGGVLHAIDKVLIPPSPEPQCKTFVDLAKDTPGFSTLYQLVVMADLADELSMFDGTVFGKKIVVYLTVSFRMLLISHQCSHQCSHHMSIHCILEQ